MLPTSYLFRSKMKRVDDLAQLAFSVIRYCPGYCRVFDERVHQREETKRYTPETNIMRI
jgi:hypothetical protein